MTTSTSRLAYDDIFELLDRAIEDGIGVRIKFANRDTVPENRGEAMQFRLRVHTARQIDRADNKIAYDSDHPMYGRSQYDLLRASIKVEDGEVFLYIEKRTLDRLTIENLTQLEAKPKPIEYLYEQPKQIESPGVARRRV